MIGPSSWFFPQASHARRAGKMQEEVSFANVTEMSGTPGPSAGPKKAPSLAGVLKLGYPVSNFEYLLGI